MGRLWRAYHPRLPAEPGTTVTLDARESHHLVRVLRLGEGGELAVFDGRGNEWTARVVEAAESATVVRLDRTVTEPAVEAALELSLFQAVLRQDRMDWVLQKATEIGISRVVLLRTERSESYPLTPRRLARWERIAIESCKQCGRRRLPAIEIADGLPSPAPPTVGLALDPDASATALATPCTGEPPADAWLLSGPQGGFTEAEMRGATASGWQAVRLGPRILRAETAGLVAAAIVLHRWADLGS